jgi:hypothetical protein
MLGSTTLKKHGIRKILRGHTDVAHIRAVAALRGYGSEIGSEILRT